MHTTVDWTAGRKIRTKYSRERFDIKKERDAGGKRKKKQKDV